MAGDYSALTVAVNANTAALERQIALAANSSGDNAAKSFGSRFASGLGAIASDAAKVLTVGAAAAFTAVGAIATKSLTGGFDRLVAIDNATAKLTGLGHSAADVQTIMNNALASVKGTAFGLGDAASQAATLVAAGIKPGQELTRTLKLTADTATIAGTSLGDMGSIFGKVAAGGKVTTEVLNQLTDRGVPAMQFLADSMGLPIDQVQALVTAGKVSFPQFQDAMEKGLGGAALSSGNTFTGAMANVNAALGRLGAAFEGPAFKLLAPFFQKLIGTIDQLAPAAAKAGEAFGNVFEKVLGWVTQLTSGKGINNITDALKGMGPALAPIVAAIGAMTGKGLSSMLGPLGELVPTLNPITAVLGGIVAASPEARSALADLAKTIMSSLAPVIASVMPAIAQLSSSLGTAFSDIFKAIGPVIAQLAPIIGDIITTLAGALGPVLKELGPAIANIASVVGGALVGAFQAFWPVLKPLIPILTQIVVIFVEIAANKAVATTILLIVAAFKAFAIVGAVINGIKTAILAFKTAWILLNVAFSLSPIGLIIIGLVALGAALVILWVKCEAFRNAVTTALQAVGAAFMWVINWVIDHWPLLVSIILGPVGIVLALVIQNFGAIRDFIVGVFTTVSNFISSTWNAIIGFFTGAISTITGAVTGFVSGVGNFFVNLGTTIWTAISNGLNAAVGFFTGLPGRVLGAIGGLGGQLVTWAVGLMSSMVSGLTSGFGSVLSFFTSLPGKIISAIGNIGGQFASIGKGIVDGILAGMGNIASAIADKVKGAASSALAGAKSLLGIGSPSKVFAAEVGLPITQGWAIGVDKGAHLVQQAIDNANYLPDGHTGYGVSVAGSLTAVGGSRGDGPTVNVYPRPDHSEVEIASMTSRSLGWAIAGGAA